MPRSQLGSLPLAWELRLSDNALGGFEVASPAVVEVKLNVSYQVDVSPLVARHCRVGS